MSVQWIRRDHRLEMVLAVCLDVAGGLLVRAKSARQLEDAVSYNLRLWRQIRAIACDRRGWPEREMLIHVADHVAAMLALDACPCVDPRDLAFVAGRNMSLACDLAAPTPLERGRDLLAAQWAAADSPLGLESWLLELVASITPETV